MADEMLNRIEKQLEGNSLALAAVAEVLQKMDSRMADEEEYMLEKEEYILAKEEEEEAEADRESIIKEIASEVATIIKSDNGMDVSGDPRPAKSTGKTAANADDSETTISPTDDIEDQQGTIQAMQKNHDGDVKDALKTINEAYKAEKAGNGDDDLEEGKVEKIAPWIMPAAIGWAASKFAEDDTDKDASNLKPKQKIQAPSSCFELLSVFFG